MNTPANPVSAAVVVELAVMRLGLTDLVDVHTALHVVADELEKVGVGLSQPQLFGFAVAVLSMRFIR